MNLGNNGHAKEIKKAVKDSPFCALSRMFESTFHEASWADIEHADAVEVARKASIKLVQDFFPKKITFSYNDKALWVTK